MALADKIIPFLNGLTLEGPLPGGVEVMNPYQRSEVREVVERFYRKYYPDDRPRTFLWGINPGRFGAGVTGISFTDPIRLEKVCGITNPFEKKQEISSVFIYEMIERYGGAERFYADHYVTAVSPLGFLRNGKNINYYDIPALQQALLPFILRTIREQLSWGARHERAFCIGEGKNFHFLERLNREHRFFEKIIPLPHPRFIMQYRYRQREKYIKRFLQALRED